MKKINQLIYYEYSISEYLSIWEKYKTLLAKNAYQRASCTNKNLLWQPLG